MPRPRKSVASYSRKFIDLFERAGSELVTIECYDEADAENHRRYLYAVRVALLGEPEVFPRAALLAPCVGLIVEGNKVHMLPKRDGRKPTIKDVHGNQEEPAPCPMNHASRKSSTPQSS